MVDLEGVQAVHLGMIAHCELMGDRVAILDPPPSLNSQQIREWRVDKAGYDSKYATLYWPWIKVFDPPSGQARVRAAVGPHGRRLGPHRRHARRAQGARERGRSAACSRSRRTITKAEHDLLNPVGINVHPGIPGPRHPRLGRAHALERPVLAVPERPPALQLPRRSRS